MSPLNTPIADSKRRSLLAGAAAALLAGCGPESGGVGPPDTDAAATMFEAPAVHAYDGPVPDTVILVMFDTLRADVLGAYGSERGLTPNLDAFAQDAMVFEAAYATSSWTRSSVASMLTGRYASSHAVLNKQDVVPETVTLLPEILEAAGPAWTFGISTNGNTSAKIGFGQGYDLYGPHPDAERRRYPGDRIGLVPGVAVTERALVLLQDSRGADAATTFGFVQYIDPHDPYFPNPEYLDEPEPPGEFSGSRIDIDRMVAGGPSALTPANIARLRHLYDGEVAYVDHAFGLLVNGLKQAGRFESAMIIVVADHGEAFWEHDVRGHGKTLFEEEIRVPFMIRLPGAQPPVRMAAPVSLVDIAPTVLDALRMPPHPDMEGRSLMPLLAGEPRPEGLDYVFAELALMENQSRAMVLHQGQKFIASYSQRGGRSRTSFELYDLGGDPQEQANLADEPGRAGRRAALLAELSAWESGIAQRAVANQSVDIEDMDSELVEELKGLGYIQD